MFLKAAGETSVLTLLGAPGPGRLLGAPGPGRPPGAPGPSLRDTSSPLTARRRRRRRRRRSRGIEPATF